MADINYNRTQEEEKALYDTLTKRITNLERVNYKKEKSITGQKCKSELRKLLKRRWLKHDY